MAEFVGPVIEVGKCIVEPIKRQVNYLCCFGTNIQNLRDEAKNLDDAKIRSQGQVDAARRNNEVILPGVDTWLNDVNKFQANISAIELEIQNVKSDCSAIKSRFSLSRKATKMVASMKELHDHGNKFGQISHPAPPASMASVPVGQTFELESRKDIEEDIMATLREKNVSIMGICGMGGVGKTTMAEKIKSRARRESLFDEIVMVVVSQPVNVLRVQQEIIELLGLRLEFESLQARAHQLRIRIMNSKRVLIILDDLWKGLNLEDIGIPHQRDLKECTSRDRNIFTAMGVEKTFEIKILSETEAWSFFKEKVGACADDPSLFPAAEQIVKECKGLPIALVTVGMALKNKTHKSVWEDAVEELRSCNPIDIPDFLAQVYNPLKLSYDLLQSKNAKSIFLLCCLYPEDHNIRILDLSLYSWGLGMFEGIRSVHVVRNKVQTLVEMLKSQSLLLDGYDDEVTKMHDVVRDVGIFIGAKEGLMDPKLSWKSWAREESNYNIDCTWISLFDAGNITVHGRLTFPNLRFLLIEGSRSDYREELQLCEDFFGSAQKLNVLSIKHAYSLISLPHSIQYLKNLRTLILIWCTTLEDISIVGELVSLEILYCDHCSLVVELPVEIGRLGQLKLLQFSNCRSLETIASGVISKLIRLEELTLTDSFRKWEWGGSEGKNASLCELNSLSNLTTLRIEIADASLVSEQINIPNLVEFDIIIGEKEKHFHRSKCYGRNMQAMLKKEVIIGDWIHQLLRITQSLILGGEGSSMLVPLLPGFQSLKQLIIWDNAKLRRLSDGGSSGATIVFPFLEYLYLEDIDDLEEIHNGPISSECFKNLQEIILAGLPKLQRLWNEDKKDSTKFLALTHMKIVKCPELQSLFSSKENVDQKNCLEGDTLHLFCKTHQVEFGRLNQLELNGYETSLSLWCYQTPIDLFTGLANLTITNCGNIKSLFSLSIAKNLVNLINMRIESCLEMEQVMEYQVDKVESSPFIKLEVLNLRELPKLKAFCDWRYTLKFPTMKEVCICNCPLMERSPISSNSLKNLSRIEIRSCSMMDHVVSWNEEEYGNDIGGQRSRNHRIIFPKLDELKLCDLPRLTSFSKGIQSIELPLLTKMEIGKFLISFVSSTENDQNCSTAINHDANDSHLFIKSEIALGRLKHLTIDGYEYISSERSRIRCNQMPVDIFTRLGALRIENCGNIKSLFSCSVARNLINLWRLVIENCVEMVKVLEDEEMEMSPFIKLEWLILRKLPKLKAFCGWKSHLRLPSLEAVYIDECPEIERFSFGSLTTPKLEVIRKDERDISDYTKDLNDALFGGDFLHLNTLFGEEEDS